LQAVTLIGSRRDCHLPLNDPDVSKVHCAILHTGRAFLLCDLCSRSGTLLNDRPVRVSALRPGDGLRAGPVRVAVELVGPQAAPAGGDATAQPPEPPQPIRLSVAGSMVDVTAGAAIIGRRSTCDIVVDTPDVSLVHAVLFAFDSRPAVADLGSRSGTFLNDKRIQLAWVGDGDRLTIGGETLTVAWEPGVAATAACPPSAEGAAEPASVTAVEPVALTGGGPARDSGSRQADLDRLAAALKLRLEHIESLKAELSQRAIEVEQVAEEARKRLALALSHEQAVTAAWQELDRWHAAREARYKLLLEQAAKARQRFASAAGINGLPNAAPIAHPFPPPPADSAGTA
jgi:pSer/pThr/pTyr-binding forkhead associated (FHA) protein